MVSTLFCAIMNVEFEFDRGGRVYEKKRTEPKNHKNHRYITANNSV